MLLLEVVERELGGPEVGLRSSPAAEKNLRRSALNIPPRFLVSYKEKIVSYKFFPENYEAVLKNIC